MQLASMARLMNPVCLPPTNLSFALPLSDAGAGAVSTAPTVALGSATATFTRATAATTVNSAGLVVSVATGVARSMYDPSTVVYNYLLQSEDFSNASNWSKRTGVSITANQEIAPNGTLTADYLVDTGLTSTNEGVFQEEAVSADGVRTISIYAKAGSINSLKLVLKNRGSDTIITSQAIELTSSWVRYSISGTTTANSGCRFEVTTNGRAGYVALWGGQIERDSTLSVYVPTTTVAASNVGDYLGYLAEGARTNLCLQSEDLSTTWALTTATVSTNAVAAPDGNTTADKLVEDATAGVFHLIKQATIASIATQVTASGWFKNAGRQNIGLQLRADDGANGGSVVLNTAAGTLSASIPDGTGTVNSTTVQAFPNGWYRVSLTVTAAIAPAAWSLRLALTNSTSSVASYNGDAASGIYCWGIQFEAAAFASSYIPTTTLAVARNADVLTYAYANNALTSAGSAYAELSTEWTTQVGTGVECMALSFEVSAACVLGNTNNASTALRLRDGTNSVVKSGLSDMNTAPRKRASSWGTGLSAVGDGAAAATGVFDGTIGATDVTVGAESGGGGSWFGTVRNVRIWNTQLADASLQALTA